MKIKMKYIVAQACLVAGASIALTSCNDFLDREPLDQVNSARVFPDCRPPGSIYHFKIQLYVLNT